MAILKWVFQPAYLLLIIVLVVLYVNREAIFSKEVAESLEAEVLLDKADALVEQLRESSTEVMAKVEEGDNVNEAVTEAKSSLSAGEALPLIETELTAAELESEKMVSAMPSLPDEPAELMVSHVPTEAPVDEVVEPEATEGAPSGDTVVSDRNMEETSVNAGIPEEAAPAADEEPQPKTTQAVEVTADETVEKPQSAENQSTSPLATWRSARAAVWQGDLDAAVQRYNHLIQLQPTNYDAHGEMGNVLLAQSKAEEAADAYAKAARLIFQAGNREMAQRVAGIVSMLNKEKGAVLFNQITR